jgi:MinD superfamily P-loop ATPase
MMKELVVISGKGGAGKTSLIASLAVLARGNSVVADCDVDAANLHLVLQPQIQKRESFVGGSKASIQAHACTACGECAELCRFDAILCDGPANEQASQTYRVNPWACEGCGVCAHFCRHQAIEFAPVVCGQWFISQTRCGPLVHARLDPGAENSGKLVTVIRKQAQQIAARQRVAWILCDGSPGIGCPVIASLSGADLALVVAEPTLSGLHDFRRVVVLLSQLGLPGIVVINKADLNGQITARIAQESERRGMRVAGHVPYDPSVIRAQMARRTVVETSHGPAAKAMRQIWDVVQTELPNSAMPSHAQLVQLERN